MDRMSFLMDHAVHNSPGYLLQELGLTEVMVLRPGQLPEKSGEVEVSRLDAEIKNRGRAFIFRRGRGEIWASIWTHDGYHRYHLLWVEFNYTSGVFSVRVVRNNRCGRAFLIPAASLAHFHLLAVRRRDLIV